MGECLTPQQATWEGARVDRSGTKSKQHPRSSSSPSHATSSGSAREAWRPSPLSPKPPDMYWGRHVLTLTPRIFIYAFGCLIVEAHSHRLARCPVQRAPPMGHRVIFNVVNGSRTSIRQSRVTPVCCPWTFQAETVPLP